VTPRRLTQSDVRRLALSLPDVEESSHHGTPDFRASGKIFSTLPPKQPSRLVVKTEPAELDLRRHHDPLTYTDAWGSRCMGVELSRVTRAEVRVLLEEAREHVTRPSRPRARAPRPRRG
jgi:hypothetical protein